jgi:hypothetical protein
MSIPEKYIPKVLSTIDEKKQKSYIKRSQRLYKRGKYYERPKVRSFKSKTSKHLEKVESIYGVNPLKVNKELSRRTKCSKKGLEKIINKGRGAYYSSGSRPNQTAESWGLARLASAITGGPSSIIDYHILDEHCKPDSKALKMARKTCKKMKKCKKYMRNKTKKNK